MFQYFIKINFQATRYFYTEMKAASAISFKFSRDTINYYNLLELIHIEHAAWCVDLSNTEETSHNHTEGD
jgi:hypothetical protein